MNIQQITQNLVHVLSPQNFLWPDPPNEAVLARVGVVPGSPDFLTLDAAAPFALIHPESSRDHPEHPADLVEEARWTVFLFAANGTDQAGGAAVVGGNRLSLGSSVGRGVLEVEPLVQAQILSALGLTARPRAVGGQGLGVSGRLPGLVADRALDVVATRIPKQPDWAPVTQLKATVAGGVVTFTLRPPLPRWDLIGLWCQRLNTTQGPATPYQGTNIPVTGLPATFTDTPPSSGNWGYSVWGAYDATRDPSTASGETTPNRFSGYGVAPLGMQPAAPAAFGNVAFGFAGTITAGVHQFYVSFVVNGAESPLSPGKAATAPGNKIATLTAIPLGPAGTSARKIYMTTAGGSVPFLVSTVSDNTTTTGSVNGSDSSAIVTQVNYTPSGLVWLPASVVVAT